MIDTLSLLALKVAPKVFDVSSGLVHVSMRDQIVRARLLVRDLAASGEPCLRILVVGAGVAGISVATAAARRGIEVVVVDANLRPLAMQAAVTTRFVGPFMYEWPSAFSSDQSYPPPRAALWPSPDRDTPQWSSATPLTASDFSAQVDKWLRRWLAASSTPTAPVFLMGVDKTDTKAAVLQFAGLGTTAMTSSFNLAGTSWPDGKAQSMAFLPDFVVLAAGMGEETVTLPGGVRGTPFWANDHLRGAAVCAPRPIPGTAGPRTAIVGGGDGALQDVMRALTIHDHPLQFIDALRADPHAAALLHSHERDLAALEQQHRLEASWTVEVDTSVIDQKCQAIARTIAQDPTVAGLVRGMMKRGVGTVCLLMRGQHFSKSYLLNRFAMHLIEQVLLLRRSTPTRRMKLIVERDVMVKNSASIGKQHLIDYVQGTHATLKSSMFDTVVVRFGIEQGTVPGYQIVSLTPPDLERRTFLAHVPVPLVI